MLRHEIFRLRSRQLLMFLVGLLLVLNGVLFVRFYSEQRGKAIYSVEDYCELWDAINEVPREEREEYFEELMLQREIMFQYVLEIPVAALVAMYDMENTGWVMELLEQYNEHPEDVLFTENIYSEQALLDAVQEEIEATLGYQAFREDLLKRGQMLLSGTIMTLQEDGYNAKNIRKTIEEYSTAPIPEISGVYDNPRGVESLSFSATNLCCILLVLYAVAELFVYEKEQGLEALVRTNVRVALPRLHWKMIAVFVFATVIAVLFSVENILLAENMFGIGDWSRPIQTVPAYSTSLTMLSVSEYAIVSTLLRVFGLCVLALLAMACTAWVRSTKTLIGLVGGVLGVEYVLYLSIDNTSYLANLRFINPVGVLQPDTWLITYRNINLFGTPVSYATVIAVVSVVVGVLSYGIVACHFCRKYTERTVARRRGARKDSTEQKVKRYSVRLWVQEIYKIGVAQHAFVLLLLVVTFGGWWIHSGYEDVREDSEEQYYQQYVERLTGPVMEETHAYIEQESLRFADMERELEELEQKVQNATSQEEVLKLNMTLMILQNQLAPKSAFERFCEYVDYVSATEEGYIVDERPYEQLYLDIEADLEQGTVVVVGLILLIPMVFYQDRDTRLIGIVGATKKGNRLLHLRLFYSGIMAVGMALVPVAVRFVSVKGAFGKIEEQGHFPAVSVQGLAEFSGWSLDAYFALMVTVRVLGALVVMLMICAIAHVVRTSISLWLTVAVVFLLPLLVALLYPSLAEVWMHLAALLGSPILAFATDAWRIVLSIFGMILVVVSGMTIRQRYSKL